MNAMRNVSYDDEDGNHDTVEPVDTICALIRRLNGLSRSCVTVFDDPQTIGAGGGENGEVVVYRTEDDTTFYNLIGDQEADGTTELFACGQPEVPRPHDRERQNRCTGRGRAALREALELRLGDGMSRIIGIEMRAIAPRRCEPILRAQHHDEHSSGLSR